MSIKFTSYPLDGICRLQMGKTPKREKAEYWGEGFPWVSIADMKGKFIETTKEQITAKAVEESGCKMIRKGTLLLSFKLSIGKLAFAGTDLFTNEAIVALYIRDYNEVYPEYLYYVLKTIPLAGKNKAAKGSTLNSKSLKKIQVPIPDKYEDQIRIATILKKIEDLIAEREESTKAFDDLLSSVLWTTFGDPSKNPNGWEVTRFENIFDSIRYGTSYTPQYLSKGIPFIRATNIKKGRISKKDLVFISEEEAAKIPNCKVNEGDLIIVRSGANTGDAATIPKEYHNAYAAYDLIVTLKKESSILYNELINSGFGRAKIKPLTKRSGQPHLNVEQVKGLTFYNPPFELQKKFAVFFDAIEKNKIHYENGSIELFQLFESTNQRIFNGKLDLSKLDVTKEMESLFELIQSAPPVEEEAKRAKRSRTSKVDKLTFTNYYEDDFATMMKNFFGKFHFRFKDIEEMFSEEEGGVLTYFTTQELKRMKEKAPKDIHTFIFDCVEKKNKNLKLNQIFYDALTDLNLKKIKLKAGSDFVLQQINNKQISREELSGIYFQIAR